jgi:hypothetical protein
LCTFVFLCGFSICASSATKDTKVHWHRTRPRCLCGVPVQTHPTTRGGRALNRVKDSLHGERIFEIRMERLLSAYRIKKVSKRRNKRMLVSQNMARLPEVFPIWMVQRRDGYAALALQIGGFGSIEEIKLVHVVESET